MKYIFKCSKCNKEFEVYKQRLNNKHIFCSKTCEAEYRKKQTLEKHNIPNTTCVVCGKQYYVKPSRLNRNKRNHCSKECFYIDKSQYYMKGKNNHQYGLLGRNNPTYNHEKQFRITSYGYKLVRDPRTGYWVKEHRLIAEMYLWTDENSQMVNGIRKLKSNYDVHHKDFNKLNNDVNNLQVLTRSQHKNYIGN